MGLSGIMPYWANLDQFTRADQDPIASGWAGPIISGHTQMKVVSNALAGGIGATSNSYWNTLLGADHGCAIDMPAAPTGAHNMGLAVRVQSPGTGTSAQRAFILIAYDTLLEIYLKLAGGTTLLNSITGMSYSINDGIAITVRKNIVTSWYKPVGTGIYAPKGFVKNDQIVGPGFIGAFCDGQNGRGDNFAGGGLTPGTDINYKKKVRIDRAAQGRVYF